MTPARSARQRGLLVVGLWAALSWLPVVAAHSGFGGSVETRFTFPPWLVWVAGGFVVALSFAVVGAFLTRPAPAPKPGARRAPVLAVARGPDLGWTAGRIVGATVLALVAVNAFLPRTDGLLPQVSLWLVVWGLLPLLAYTVGDVWPRVSPFHGLAMVADTARGMREPVRWPRWLGAWPATGLFVALVGLEVSEAPWGHETGPLALLILTYAFVTVVGMAVFGAESWLANAEVVTRSLRWWRAASPFVWRQGRLQWRGATASLAALPVRRLDDVAFTVAVLYGVNFDGFLATAPGRAALDGLSSFAGSAGHAVLLVAGYLFFLMVWLSAAWGIRRAALSLKSVRRLAAALVASLLPIAVGYHAAHQVFTLVETLPSFVYAVLDPLGFAGWPEAFVHPPSRVVFPASWGVWLATVQVLLVLAGHVLAVVVAHGLAERAFPSRIMALRGEVPLTLVMVLYTWIGLWVLTNAGGGAA